MNASIKAFYNFIFFNNEKIPLIHFFNSKIPSVGLARLEIAKSPEGHEHYILNGEKKIN